MKQALTNFGSFWAKLQLGGYSESDTYPNDALDDSFPEKVSRSSEVTRGHEFRSIFEVYGKLAENI